MLSLSVSVSGMILLGLSSCAALSALSALTPSSNSGTQVKAHAEIGDNKRQQQVALKGSAVRLKENRGELVGGNKQNYDAKDIRIHNHGLSWKEMVLILSIIIIVIVAHRVPWKFWKRS